ncbi:GNAT family N-acetyltransferase [Nocardia inohanensis]|uniref:GNAT family N-acetyltransferase n=1 Tax=Nocardia inohanensis TaxID=209246 RepID=UPI00082F4977|nr:GNAT family N-acetyltransferase [Nocardia inohanensis]
MTEPIVTQHTEKLPNRYEITVDGTLAGQTDYVDSGAQRIFFHTEIDDGFAGQGLASKLIRAALDDTRAQGKRIVPVCPFVKAFVEKNHEFDDILDKVTPESIATVEAALN